jgi:copper(I)-binding protein
MRNPHLDGGPWALALALACAIAAPAAHAIVTVNAPWIRAVGGAGMAEAYMELRSTDGATLVGVTSDAAARVTIRPPGQGSAALEELRLPAGKVVLLAPGRHRLGLTHVARPLKRGDRVPLTLVVRNGDGTRQEIPINAEVRRRSAIDDHLHPHAH